MPEAPSVLGTSRRERHSGRQTGVVPRPAQEGHSQARLGTARVITSANVALRRDDLLWVHVLMRLGH